ncbi:hypothetical protein HRbin28_02232 [bacterium HR28]|nr:hypothetical protein HRbin28_02232 [bacterium HR28]
MPLFQGLIRYARSLRALPRDIRLFFVYALFSNVAIGAFTLLYNLYLIQLGYREDFIGLVNAASTGALALSALGLGRLLHQRGSWWCLTYGTGAYLAASTILALATQPAVVLASAILQGMATTFLFVPLMPFVIDHAPTVHRATVAAVALSLTSVSSTIGSLLAGWLPSALGTVIGLPVPGALSYRAALLAGIGVCAVAIVPLLLMREARDRPPQATSTLHIHDPKSNSWVEIRRYLTAFVIAGGLLSIGNGAVVPFYNVYLDTLGLSARTIGVIYAVASLVGALFGLVGPAIARICGPLRAVTIIRFAPVPVFASLMLLQAIPLAIAAHVIRMISISMAWPIDSMLVAETLPSRARANAFSFRSAAWNIGFAAASFLGGRLIVTFGYVPVFALYTLFCTAAIAYFVQQFRHHPAAHARAGSIPSVSEQHS